MADREKVIQGLLNISDAITCDFIRDARQAVDTIEDAVALLKEQESVEPKKIKGFNQPCYVHYAFICENCKTDLIQGQQYCAGCGRSVKWE